MGLMSATHEKPGSGLVVATQIPSRERSHIQPGEKENHLQKCLGMGYVNFQEGIFVCSPDKNLWKFAPI